MLVEKAHEQEKVIAERACLHDERHRHCGEHVRCTGSHVDWLDMRHGSDAYRSLHRAAAFTYDLSLFLSDFPSSMKTRDAVAEALHLFDDVHLDVEVSGSTGATELWAVSKNITTIRPFVHFTSIPHRHAAKAERTNRTAAGGTRTIEIQDSLSEPCMVTMHMVEVGTAATGSRRKMVRRHTEGDVEKD